MPVPSPSKSNDKTAFELTQVAVAATFSSTVVATTNKNGRFLVDLEPKVDEKVGRLRRHPGECGNPERLKIRGFHVRNCAHLFWGARDNATGKGKRHKKNAARAFLRVRLHVLVRLSSIVSSMRPRSHLSCRTGDRYRRLLGCRLCDPVSRVQAFTLNGRIMSLSSCSRMWQW